MRFIIHIGPRKTGTTYLQDTFYRSRDALLARGIFYHSSVAALGPSQSSRSVIDVALKQKLGDAIAAEFVDAAAVGAHTAIISDENLARMTEEELSPLRDTVQRLAGNDPVTVVAYCRRWSDRLPSLWAEQVKQGGWRDLATWLLFMMGGSKLNGNIDETQIWELWAKLFGSRSLRIVSYDVMMAARADIARDFLAQFADTSIEFPAEKLSSGNIRPKTGELELLRRLNFLARTENRVISEPARMRLLREVRNENDTLPASLEPAHGMTCVISDKSALFGDTLARMRRFARPHVMPRNGDRRLMIPSTSRTDSPSGVLAIDETLAPRLRHAYARLLEIEAELALTGSQPTRAAADMRATENPTPALA